MAEENIQELLTPDKLSAVDSVVTEIKKDPGFADFNFDLKSTIKVQDDLDKTIGALSDKILPSSSAFMSFDEFQKRKVATADKGANGQEKNSPKPNVDGDVPKSGQPSLQQNAMGWVDVGSLIGKLNVNLQHTCDFTIDLKFKACGLTIDILTANTKAMVMLKMEELLTAKLPFIAHIIAFIKMLKEWFDYIMYYVKMITDFIKCMADLINAIMAFAKQLMSLPSSILGQISNCLNSLRSLLLNSVSGVMKNNALTAFVSEVEQMKGQVAAAGNSIKGSVSSIKNSIDSAKTTFSGDNITNQLNGSVDNLTNSAMKWTEPPKMDVGLLNRMTNLTNTSSIQNAYKMP